MTLFDWYVVGFIPVAIVLIVLALIDNDWDVEKLMFKDDE